MSSISPLAVTDRRRTSNALRLASPGLWIVALGALAMTLPTMVAIAQFSWSTEQGGHGPLVLATGLWLFWRQGGAVRALAAPGDPVIAGAAFVVCLIVYLFARITGILEIEGFALYGVLLSVAYVVIGGRAMRHLWFPILYFAFVFPPPNTVVAAVTQPIKILISSTAVSMLYALGYPVASSGVTIQIAQYQLLIAAACAGLNSIISLAAICLFYIYIRHNANYRYVLLMFLTILPIAIFANFVRVVFLMLLTYYAGEGAAQGFMHDFAGLVMFTVALISIMAIDVALTPIRTRLEA